MKHNKKEETFGLMVKKEADVAEHSRWIQSVLVRLSPATR